MLTMVGYTAGFAMARDRASLPLNNVQNHRTLR